MTAPGIRLPSGRLVPWDAFRRTMLASRPRGAYDEAPSSGERGGILARPDQATRFAARDRRRGDQGAESRGLSREYVSATLAYLKDHGVEPQDIDAVTAVLGAYLDEAETADQRAGLAPHLGAADRMAFDRWGNRIRMPGPRSAKQNEDFAKRYPDVARIKVV